LIWRYEKERIGVVVASPLSLLADNIPVQDAHTMRIGHIGYYVVSGA
jgi:hypothetical protein